MNDYCSLEGWGTGRGMPGGSEGGSNGRDRSTIVCLAMVCRWKRSPNHATVPLGSSRSLATPVTQGVCPSSQFFSGANLHLPVPQVTTVPFSLTPWPLSRMVATKESGPWWPRPSLAFDLPYLGVMCSGVGRSSYTKCGRAREMRATGLGAKSLTRL